MSENKAIEILKRTINQGFKFRIGNGKWRKLNT